MNSFKTSLNNLSGKEFKWIYWNNSWNKFNDEESKFFVKNELIEVNYLETVYINLLKNN